MIRSLLLLLGGYAVGAGAAEPVAVLKQPQGRVLVSQNATMGPARDGMSLYAGDRVVAVAGGRVEVTYSGGCAVTLRENTLLAVKAGQCKNGVVVGTHGIEGFQRKMVGQAPPAGSAAGTDPGDAFKARLYRPVKTLVDTQGDKVAATTNMGLTADDVIHTEAQGGAWVYFNGCEVRVGPGEDVSVVELQERCKASIWDNPDSGRTDPVAAATGPVKTAGLKSPKGDVQVIQGTARAQAKPNMSVFSDNRIKTGPNSEVIVVFGGCGVEVTGDRQVSLDELKTVCLVPYWAAGGVAAVAIAIGSQDNQPTSPQ